MHIHYTTHTSMHHACRNRDTLQHAGTEIHYNMHTGTEIHYNMLKGTGTKVQCTWNHETKTCMDLPPTGTRRSEWPGGRQVHAGFGFMISCALYLCSCSLALPVCLKLAMHLIFPTNLLWWLVQDAVVCSWLLQGGHRVNIIAVEWEQEGVGCSCIWRAEEREATQEHIMLHINSQWCIKTCWVGYQRVTNFCLLYDLK